MTKVSVIVPVYNSEIFLEKCLNSIVNQTLKDIEIICVDDGSTDNSLKIINEFAAKDTRIIVKSQPNSGQSIARNNAMKIANGEYIGFVDSDDWIDLDFFEKLYNAAAKYKADIAEAGVKRETKTKTYKLIEYKKNEIYESTYLKLKISKIPNCCYSVNKIYLRNKLISNDLFFIENIFYEDIIHTTKTLFCLDKLVVVPETFYHYTFNENSITNTKSKKNINDYNYAYDFIYKFAEDNNFVIPDMRNSKDLTKIYCKVFGIVILKIFKWKRSAKYYLFGLIPVLETETKIYGEE